MCGRQGKGAEDGPLKVMGCERAQPGCPRCTGSLGSGPPPIWIILLTSPALVSTAVNRSCWSSGAPGSLPALVDAQLRVTQRRHRERLQYWEAQMGRIHTNSKRGEDTPTAEGSSSYWSQGTASFPPSTQVHLILLTREPRLSPTSTSTSSGNCHHQL